MKPVHLFLLLVWLLVPGCQTPEIDGILPGTGFARQIVQVEGTPLDFSRVIWDADTPTETTTDQALFSARYFQVPVSAAAGRHPVKLRNRGGASAAAAHFMVRPLSGVWPAPRIEEVTVRQFRESGSGKADLLLLLSVANADARAAVTVNGLPCNAVLYSAITTDFFNTHHAASFAYPVYHYAGLLLALNNQIPGASLHITVKNTDNRVTSTTYTLPAGAAALDSDNDGLPDAWETSGYPAPGGGIIDLAALGCHPLRKDILVEVDWTAVAQPLNTIWADIEAVFANAPVLNPDGSAGISIHIDRGQGGVFNRGGQTLRAHTVMDFGVAAAAGYTDFFTYKKTNFDAARLEIFHYCVFGRARPNGCSGRGEIWGNDFMVTFATFPEWRDPVAQVGTFIHELGHNLGLRHGGIDNAAADANETFKPNQESAMNYRYQFPGIAPAIQSYSRGMYRNIDERNIDETLGICDHLPVDFNGNGAITNPVSANTNASLQDNDNTDNHFNYNEWGNLRLNFRAKGSRWGKN